jgi:hypothetical protein
MNDGQEFSETMNATVRSRMPALTLNKISISVSNEYYNLHWVIPRPFCRAEQSAALIAHKTAVVLVVGPDERSRMAFNIYPRRNKFFEGSCVVATSRVRASLELY